MADFARRHAKSKDEKMSLLETFFLKFQSDGLKEISAETEGTTQKADKMGNSFVSMSNKVLKALAPVAGLTALLNRSLAFASLGEEMSFLAQNTGLAVEKFQALAIAAENYGGTAEGIAGSMQGLNANLNNMRLGKGGGGVEDAAVTYGINLYGANGLATADELLMNVAKRFESLNQTQQIDLGQRLGLDEGTIRLLQTGVANVQAELERGRKYSLFSAEDVENSRKFERTMRDIKLGLAQIFGVVARSLLPAFTWVGDKVSRFIDLINGNASFIKGFFLALSAILTVLAIKSGLAFLPFIGAIALITAVSAAIGLLIDDIVNFWQGNESLLGTFIEAVKNVFTALWNFLKEGFNSVLEWLKGTKVGKLFGLSEEKENPEQANMAEAKRKLELTQTPWASVPQGSVSTSYANTNQSMRVDNVTINTRATDARGIADSFSNLFQTTMQNSATSHL
jgi:phage-related protein